ncbi:MAG: hypothetical protein ABMA13_19165 [Chthoniobacteraceae bacterium]
MTPGRLLYLLKTKFGHGLRVAWYRDVIRPRILATPPIPVGADTTCEIHALTSGDDWLNLMWALKSFLRASGRRYALCIHDDGTLGADASAHLLAAFPGARLIARSEADRRLADRLARYPRCAAFRASNKLAPKVFDFAACLESDRMMLLDSDILFFSKPDALLAALETGTANALGRDWRYGYCFDLATIQPMLDFTLPPLINSGLGLVRKDSIRLDWIEEFLALPGVENNTHRIDGHSHRIEQTLIALSSARSGFTMLPAEYDVYLGAMRAEFPSRHYAGPTRHLMYREGMRRLVDAGFLKTS